MSKGSGGAGTGGRSGVERSNTTGGDSKVIMTNINTKQLEYMYGKEAVTRMDASIQKSVDILKAGVKANKIKSSDVNMFAKDVLAKIVRGSGGNLTEELSQTEINKVISGITLRVNQ